MLKLFALCPRRRIPLTLLLGLLIIVVCEVFLYYDVKWSGRGALHTEKAIDALLANPPADKLGLIARFVAVNMTALVWAGYLLLLEGILTWQTGASPVRKRPHHFAMLALASVFLWCVFDWINFYFFHPHAWSYLGMPGGFWDRFWGYLLAFAAIVPGMLMSGQVWLNMGVFNRARSRGWRMPAWVKFAAFIIGVVMFAWPFVGGNSIANYTLWTSLVLLLDPINLLMGRPSTFRDWQNGWYGRTLAAFAGGLTCGFLWEFWNYWALAKWVYHLPFLGITEHIKYFEMPVVGLLGFIPFGLECWVMWQLMRIPLDGLVEPLPNERSLL